MKIHTINSINNFEYLLIEIREYYIVHPNKLLYSLYFQLARHEAREKEVALASKEGVLMME